MLNNMSPTSPKNKLKIGLVCPYNMFLGGGVQECVLALREGIQRRGHEAYIITPQPRGHDSDPGKGIITIGGAAKFKSFFHTSTQVSASVDTDKLEETLRRENFDILHFHEPWNPILSRQIMTRSDTINIGTFHATLPERALTKTIERVITPYTRSILKYLDVLTAVSTPASSYVKSLSSRKVHIVPNGIDLDKYTFEPRQGNRRTKTIFYVGRLEKRKGIKYLLNAFQILNARSDEHYELIIAGDGPDRKTLEELVMEKKIPGVKFIGFIDEATKIKLFHEADVFCSPALYGESFGIVLLEAMATGCVVVAGNNRGYETVLKGAGQISIVNPKDSLEFARRLSMLATNESLRNTWKNWANEEVHKYDYSKVIGQYIELYETAYAKKHS